MLARQVSRQPNLELQLSRLSAEELAVTRVVSWGQELELLTEKAGRAALEVLHGTLVRIDADGSAELRVGGVALHVSTQGSPPPVGTKVRLSGCEITAYPSHL